MGRRTQRADGERKLTPIERLRFSIIPILQCGVAAGASWWFATVILNHVQPFFAPAACTLTLGVARGAKLRRSFELIIGVAIGIGVGDFLVRNIGSGPWQIGLVVLLALTTAVLVDGGALLALQAASSAVLVATLIPPAGVGGPERVMDAVVGGMTGVIVLIIVPSYAVRQVRDDINQVITMIIDPLRIAREGLFTRNYSELEEGLRLARTAQPSIDRMRESRESAESLFRISFFCKRSRRNLFKLERVTDSLDNASRNVRILVRHSENLLRNNEIVPGGLLESFDEVIAAIKIVQAKLCSDKEIELDYVRSDLSEACKNIRLRHAGPYGMYSKSILSQIEAIVEDFSELAEVHESDAQSK